MKAEIPGNAVKSVSSTHCAAWCWREIHIIETRGMFSSHPIISSTTLMGWMDLKKCRQTDSGVAQRALDGEVEEDVLVRVTQVH